MTTGIRQLYETLAYPAMSHPLADPAVSTVAAWIGGLDAVPPSRARILEIGCSSGHNLIPLAMRWPDARFTGIDLAEPSIRKAKELAAIAGVRNVAFHALDLREFPAEPAAYDVIIAHGFFSWVPDEVKAALLDFCRRHLAPDGFATISFNLESGWRRRRPVIDKVRAIQAAGDADAVTALHALRSVTDAGSSEREIIDDMLAKGPDILAFDDFGPVNDPWPLDGFVAAAESTGLSWIGESDPGRNFPETLPPEILADLRARISDPLALQSAADEATGRTFRSGVLCRSDARRLPGIDPKRLLQLPLRLLRRDPGSWIDRAFQTVDPSGCSCQSFFALRESFPEISTAEWAQEAWRGMLAGSLQFRSDEVLLNQEIPGRPTLNPFRLACARGGLPLVDAWQVPCAFPERHYGLLAAMDGGRGVDELRVLAREQCPELRFEPWIRHLAGRGMFG